MSVYSHVTRPTPPPATLQYAPYPSNPLCSLISMFPITLCLQSTIKTHPIALSKSTLCSYVTLSRDVHHVPIIMNATAEGIYDILCVMARYPTYEGASRPEHESVIIQVLQELGQCWNQSFLLMR